MIIKRATKENVGVTVELIRSLLDELNGNPIEYAGERKWNQLEVGVPAYPQWARTKQFYLREGFMKIGPRLKYVF